jgi:hypothetical protein
MTRNLCTGGSAERKEIRLAGIGAEEKGGERTPTDFDCDPIRGANELDLRKDRGTSENERQ